MSVLDLQSDHVARQIDVLVKAHGEQFIMKGEFEEAVKDHRWVLVVTNKSLYKFIPGSLLTEPHATASLMDVHAVESDPRDSRVFMVYTYKYKNRLRLNKAMGAMGLGMNFESFLQRRQYCASTAQEALQWVFILKRLLRNLWQRTCEDLFIPKPEVYQMHSFVIKLNRKNRAQDRVLLVSTKWIYNLAVTHNPTILDHKSKKWALPLACLTCLTTIGESQLIVNFNEHTAQKMLDDEHMGEKGAALNEQHIFLFRSYHERQALVAEIQRLFLLQPGVKRPLQVRNRGGGTLSPSDDEEKDQGLSPRLQRPVSSNQAANNDGQPTSPKLPRAATADAAL